MVGDEPISIDPARASHRDQLGELLEEYRNTLVARAERKLGTMIQQRMGASDVVQQTYLEAFRAIEDFRGESPGELVAWLTKILDHNITNAVRDHQAGKRNVKREQTLRVSTGLDSHVMPASEPVADVPSPSTRAIQHEDENYVDGLLGRLPADQQTAVRLRYQGMSLTEIADQMDRTKSSVASLIKRGLQNLRANVTGAESTGEEA